MLVWAMYPSVSVVRAVSRTAPYHRATEEENSDYDHDNFLSRWSQYLHHEGRRFLIGDTNVFRRGTRAPISSTARKMMSPGGKGKGMVYGDKKVPKVGMMQIR
jgi:hypothetical protein